jgi:hypothetical protein
MRTLPSLTRMLLKRWRIQNRCLDFRANYTSFPPEYATPNLGKFLAVLKGVEGWKNGRLDDGPWTTQ